MRAKWKAANQSYIASNRQVADVAGGFGSTSRSLRMMLQSAVLGVGAYFVIYGEATAGIIIALPHVPWLPSTWRLQIGRDLSLHARAGID
jgi:ABC-type protease/lipase transport system fused ATPase/permease subunit